MKLKKLFNGIPGIEIRGSKEVEIMGLCAHSRRVAPGDLFIAKRGFKRDGSEFINEAILAGAVAILTDIYNPFLEQISQIIHPNPNAIEAEIANRFYDYPSDKLNTIAITGTNGKTTVAYLARFLLEDHIPVGMIGTVETITGKHRMLSEFTTPDCLTLHKLLKEMVINHCPFGVMEVTSHAIDQKRIQGIRFDRFVFTNLSQDHLDYHKTYEEYHNVKASLFTEVWAKQGAMAIVNADSCESEKMISDFPGQVIFYSMQKPSDIWASDIELFKDRIRFILHAQDHEGVVEVPLIGLYNISNILAACAIALSYKKSFAYVLKKLSQFPGVKGRMERIPSDQKDVYIDFAHTPDALKSSLQAIRPLTKGKIIAVFGAGGDRDAAKRPIMGGIAAHNADVTILTSDNPRSEDPQAIAEAIREGMDPSKEVIIELDRRKAIALALEKAGEQDSVLIAGKGHETRQIFRHRTIDFDDYQIAKELMGT